MKNMELPFIKDMFEAIAPRYDLLNRLLSLRQDVYWRRLMVSVMELPDNGKVLDVACGTGDVAFEILRQKGLGIRVFGVDFSPGMLVLAKNKIRDAISCPGFSKPSEFGKYPNIYLIAGNAFHLPFKKETFDAITIAFGIRNIRDKLSALKVFHDSLKPGGMLFVLELATPRKDYYYHFIFFILKKFFP
ncbi:Ubiquinone/menaquinone biosynthesis methyltransferase family protein [Desulfonema magnum]|uniref:Ubiquinone/menaquinone biosynthesis methyltransferase family protein n=1 Tax=Desulfonema magnum TaxID=45655 RepID=A0A975BG50_9BACT|nr:Ubiquinone/menaquinone biosynthesis methyltransferase family protein [Desulfonema magnum]